MKRTLLLIAALACALPLAAKDTEKDREKAARKAEKAAAKAAAAGAAATPAGDSPNAPGFDGFRNVKLKNIFDPTRRGMRSEATAADAASADAVKRGRSLALTGTMVTEGKSLAFFSGSAADGNRVVTSGNSVAGYKLAAIAPTQVALEHEGKQIVLQVGRQLTFEADGATGAAAPVVEKAAEPMAEITGAPALPGVSGDKADILRKMMERRAKEVGK